MESQEDIERRLIEGGILVEGLHARLASGLCSDKFLVKNNVTRDMTLLDFIAREMAERHLHLGIDTVLVPATGAIAIGYWTARWLSEMTGKTVRIVFANKPAIEGSPLELKRGYGEAIRGKQVTVVQPNNDARAGIWQMAMMSLAARHGAENTHFVHLNAWTAEETFELMTNPTASASVEGLESPEVIMVEANDDIPHGIRVAMALAAAGERVQFVYAERQTNSSGRFDVRPEFVQFVTDKRILVCEDIVTSGGSLDATVAVTEAIGGNVIATCGLWSRGDYNSSGFTALVRKPIPAYQPGPDTCPGCRDNMPYSTQYGRGPR